MSAANICSCQTGRGLDCDSIDDASDEATRAVIELASMMLLTGSGREWIIEVRQGGHAVLRAEVRLQLQRVQRRRLPSGAAEGPSSQRGRADVR
jgi:hypothetical protein